MLHPITEMVRNGLQQVESQLATSDGFITAHRPQPSVTTLVKTKKQETKQEIGNRQSVFGPF
jgi:hypothetical protein